MQSRLAEPELDPQPASQRRVSATAAMDAAVSCAGVPPQSALLSSSHSFAADAAIAHALHFSLSDHAAAPAPEPAMPGGAVAGTDCPGPAMAVAAAPSSPWCRLGPAGGQAAGKRRRPRPSKRVPTTYISTDAATFRAMVQRVTGADEADLQQQQQQQQDGLGIGLLLPHLGGVEQFLQAAAAGHASHVAVAAAATYATAAAEQQPLFPTLDSWNVMYGNKNEVVSSSLDCSWPMKTTS